MVALELLDAHFEQVGQDGKIGAILSTLLQEFVAWAEDAFSSALGDSIGGYGGKVDLALSDALQKVGLDTIRAELLDVVFKEETGKGAVCSASTRFSAFCL